MSGIADEITRTDLCVRIVEALCYGTGVMPDDVRPLLAELRRHQRAGLLEALVDCGALDEAEADELSAALASKD